jgi:predicted ATP-grasp superfamily ATP-dependent carboligase
METAADKLSSSLGLSGFYGFDFILEAGTQQAFLLEINPRATPIAHLTPRNGTNLIAALLDRLAGEPPRSIQQPVFRDLVALFPDGIAVAEQQGLLDAVHLDVPWDEPWLLESVACEDPSLRRMIQGSFRHSRRLRDEVTSIK